MALAMDRGLTNLRIFQHDAVEVLQHCIAPQSLARVQLYFPDPWHKKKHNKRRIVQEPFVDLIAEKLKPSGILHMATDWEPYAEYMVEVLAESPRYQNVAGDKIYAAAPDYRPKTKFEKRGEKLGHGVWDLLYQTPS